MKPIDLSVEQAAFVDESMPGDMPEEETGMKTWQKVLIGVGVALLLIVLTIVIIRVIRRKKRQQEEAELAAVLDEIIETDESRDGEKSGKDGGDS
jgi:flagellar biosynthesis/type III secretory pathway M-ring protein FliF/YscJ